MTTGRIEAGINDVYVLGTVEEQPVFVHNERGYGIHEGVLAVPRRSGEIDYIPFAGTQETIGNLQVGDYVSITGVIRHRDRSAFPASKRRTVVYVDGVSYAERNWPAQNNVSLSGHVCRIPNFRTTPRGRDLCELTIAVPRGNGPQDYILCIAWNDMAHVARNLAVGTGISVSGRFQSRRYTKRLPNGDREERFAYEVSLDSMY